MNILKYQAPKSRVSLVQVSLTIPLVYSRKSSYH